MSYNLFGSRSPKNGSSSYAPVAAEENKAHGDSLYDEYKLLQLQSRSLKRWLMVLGGLLGFSVVLLLLSLNVNDMHSIKHSGPQLLTPVPELPTEIVTFDQDVRYAGPSTGDRDRAWGSLMPIGQGFIVVNESQKYNLQPGKNTTFGELYDVSMFHQLHCLTEIRNYLFTLQMSMDRNNTQQIFDILLAPKEHHVFHCLDYIRQGIMCAGDMTIEWPREEADGRRFAVDGWGVPHQCKSWDAIMDFMETHRSPGDLGR